MKAAESKKSEAKSALMNRISKLKKRAPDPIENLESEVAKPEAKIQKTEDQPELKEQNSDKEDNEELARIKNQFAEMKAKFEKSTGRGDAEKSEGQNLNPLQKRRLEFIQKQKLNKDKFMQKQREFFEQYNK